MMKYNAYYKINYVFTFNLPDQLHANLKRDLQNQRRVWGKITNFFYTPTSLFR